MSSCVQKMFAPNSICFGCGPKNSKGLQIQSHLTPEGALVATFVPQEHHQAFPGMLNGGIVGALLDCHSNWCAAMALMKARELGEPPCTVTAKFCVELLAPTPSSGILHLHAVAKPISPGSSKVEVEASVRVNDQVTAKCHGIFVAVKEGHPAFHRWG